MSKSKPKTSGKVLIFYDGGCPLCVKEMRHLKRLDTNNKLAFENINVKDFSARTRHRSRCRQSIFTWYQRRWERNIRVLMSLTL